MRNRNEFVQLIDRYRLGQVQRLAIGATLSPDFSTIFSSLILTEGRGKFLRVRWIENRSLDIAASVASACRTIAESDEPSLPEFAQVRVDLTRVLATATNQVATVSGNHARMLMTSCIDDPGIWLRDYDGKQTFQSFCQPSLLSELTGLTTIDALPFRDLAAGGRGWPLDPLPNWLLFADRDQRVAEHSRLMVDLDQYTNLTWLPESDGLDNELPAIRYRRMLGREFHDLLMATMGHGNLTALERFELGDTGKVREELARLWSDLSNHLELDKNQLDTGQLETALGKSIELIQQNRWPVGDVLKSFAHYLALGVQQFLSKFAGHVKVQLIAGGESANDRLLLNECQSLFDFGWLDLSDINFDPSFLRSTLAGIHGLMSVDQMPATVPWLTGTESPRVLGRLTPGSPSNWRRVIMEMGDCRPPVMKLRDAV